MINLNNARYFCDGDINEIINFKIAKKSTAQYELHHCEEIINNKTNKPITTIEELEKCDAKDIKYTSSAELKVKNLYYSISPKKIICIPRDEHRNLHKKTKDKLLSLTKEKDNYINGRKFRHSAKGTSKIIREHYYPKHLSPQEMDKERRFYEWNQKFSWEVDQSKRKTSIKNGNRGKMKNLYITKYKLNPQKFENFLQKNEKYYSKLYNKYMSQKEIYWEIILKEAENIQKLIQKLR